MPRPTQTLVDSTPLDGASVDAQVRLGWMLRTARVHAGVSMAELSTRLGDYGVPTSLAMLSVFERTGVRDGQVIDGYEHALGLPMGWLRAPIDILCHMWSGAVADRNPHPVWLRERRHFDELHERVSGDAPTGGDWFHFARFVGPVDSGWALPSRLLRPLVDRLVRELVRGVGPAYATRYCALGHFQAGDCWPVVEESLRALVAEDGGESVVINAVAAVAEHPSRSLIQWAAELLVRDSPWAVSAASFSIQNMRECGTLPAEDWALVVPHFLRAHELAEGDAERDQTLTSLFKTLPPSTRQQIKAGLTRPLAPVPAPAGWSVDRRNTHYGLCEEVAHTLTADTPLGEQPLLARLLFELVFDFRSTRRAGAAQMLMCGPLVDPLEEALLELRLSGPDEVTRHGALRGLHFVQAGRVREGLQAWIDRERPYADPSAMCAAGNAGVRLPDDALDAVTVDGDAGLRVVEALGMAADPRLWEVVETTTDPTVRRVATWWLANGGRVTT